MDQFGSLIWKIILGLTQTIRRQWFWNRRLRDLAERFAHLLFDIRRLDCGIAIAVD